jgi:plastocyanin
MSHWRRVTLTTIAVALTACGGSADSSGGYTSGPSTQPNNPTPPTTPTGPVSTNSVMLLAASFDPSSITVPVNTTVNWQWNSCSGDGYGGYGTCVTHSIVFDDGSGITSDTQSSGTFSRTFTKAGTYKYHCAIHGQSMSGSVTVTSP